MLIKKYIAYLGIKEPATPGQVKVEIAGLKHAIRVAKERVANLEQAVAIADLQKEELNAQKDKSLSEEKSRVQTSDSEVKEGPEESGAVSGEV